MKKIYQVGGDLFIATAFVCFFIGIVGKIAQMLGVNIGVQPQAILAFSMMCLMFSIALSLYDLTERK